MRLRRSGRTVCVEVHDVATTPSRTSGLPGEDAESGRGTYIVTALASDTGVRSIDGDGKVVWAEFEQPDRRGPGGQEPDDQG